MQFLALNLGLWSIFRPCYKSSEGLGDGAAVAVLAVRTDKLSSVPRTHVQRERVDSPGCPLPATHVLWHRHRIHVRMCAHTDRDKMFCNSQLAVDGFCLLSSFPVV